MRAPLPTTTSAALSTNRDRAARPRPAFRVHPRRQEDPGLSFAGAGWPASTAPSFGRTHRGRADGGLAMHRRADRLPPSAAPPPSRPRGRRRPSSRRPGPTPSHRPGHGAAALHERDRGRNPRTSRCSRRPPPSLGLPGRPALFVYVSPHYVYTAGDMSENPRPQTSQMPSTLRTLPEESAEPHPQALGRASPWLTRLLAMESVAMMLGPFACDLEISISDVLSCVRREYDRVKNARRRSGPDALDDPRYYQSALRHWHRLYLRYCEAGVEEQRRSTPAIAALHELGGRASLRQVQACCANWSTLTPRQIGNQLNAAVRRGVVLPPPRGCYGDDYILARRSSDQPERLPREVEALKRLGGSARLNDIAAEAGVDRKTAARALRRCRDVVAPPQGTRGLAWRVRGVANALATSTNRDSSRDSPTP